MCNYRLKTIDYDSNSIFTRYDITDLILNCFKTYYAFDEEGNYLFLSRDILLTVPIIINEKQFGIQTHVKMPCFVRKGNRITLKIDSVIGYMSNYPEIECSILILDSSDLIRFNMVNGVEKINNNSNEKEIKMFDNFKIKEIELIEVNKDTELEIKLNNTEIKIEGNSVKIKADNKIKGMDYGSFEDLIINKFKDKQVSKLTSSERKFINDSGLIKRIELVESVDIDELLF